MTKSFVGVDLGGTSMKIGVTDSTGNLLAQTEKPTIAEEGAERTIHRLNVHIKELVASAGISWDEVSGIGLGLPGFLDLKQGIVIHLTNLHWEQVPICKQMESSLDKPVIMNNDANVAALGESWVGAGVGVDDLVCVTLGTGVGGGIIANGQLVSGFRGFAGEIGHIQVDSHGQACNCGCNGCLETIASATGMVNQATSAIQAGTSTLLTQEPTITPAEIFAAAAKGDALAKQIIQRTVEALAQGFAHLSVILNPQRFVVGGGVSNAGEALFQPLRQAYRQIAQQHSAKDVEIVPAKLGNQAGIIGAAGLVALFEDPS
ncbi:glucokinase [Seinonella peptonophila]|uniref:Glucokinase n=1 Tax=Seinonella peptonophila TaxID=112248 RepID=A0A1M4XME1_9BACL|nr:ROK family glucokinase [Seinonella peptonophila]SHE94787.1 glucokinase [Seinonella peptonophila]